MGYTVASILPRAAAKLNDSEQTLFTNDALMPYAQDAADELQMQLELYGILVLEKRTAPIIVPAGTKSLAFPPTGPPLLPADMLEPQRLSERLSGSQDQYTPMTMRMWEPNILPTENLRYWVYREEDIKFVGALSARDVQLDYIKRLIVVTDQSSIISVNNSQLFMICKIASIAALDIGENPTRGADLQKEAGGFLSDLIRIGVKTKQRTRTRRRPWTLAGGRRWV
jgi:hypothetical protein